MSILNYIERIKRENEGPRITAQEPRNMAQGGMIGKPGGLVEPGVEYYAKKVKKGTYSTLMDTPVEELRKLGFTGKKYRKVGPPGKRYSLMTEEFKTWIKEQTPKSPTWRQGQGVSEEQLKLKAKTERTKTKVNQILKANSEIKNGLRVFKSALGLQDYNKMPDSVFAKVVKGLGKDKVEIEGLKKVFNQAIKDGSYFTKGDYRKEMIVKTYMDDFAKHGQFTGEAKFNPILKEFKHKIPENAYKEINKTFGEWARGDFEVDGFNRSTLDKHTTKNLTNWKPVKDVTELKLQVADELIFLNDLNDTKPNLSGDEVKKRFDKKFKNKPYWLETSFENRSLQLYPHKVYGEGRFRKVEGVEIGERSPWLKKVYKNNLSGNFSRILVAADSFEEAGNMQMAKKYRKAANDLFGSKGIITKVGGQAEHPWFYNYGKGLFQIDSLIKGDLNNFKANNFEIPIRNLINEYDSTTKRPTLARKKAIEAEVKLRRDFLNSITDIGDGGMARNVKFDFKADPGKKITNTTPDIYQLHKTGKLDPLELQTRGTAYRDAVIKNLTKTDHNIMKKGSDVMKTQKIGLKQQKKILDQISKTFKEKGITLKKGQAGFIATDILKDAGKLGGKGLRLLSSDWVWPEIVIGWLDKQNNIQKGMSEERASSEMWKSVTLGLRDKGGTENAILGQLKKLGYGEKDIKAAEHMMRYGKLSKEIEETEEGIKSMEEGYTPFSTEKGAQQLREKLENLKKEQESVAGFYFGAIGDKDPNYGYELYDQASKELMRTEWNRSLEGRKKRTDPYAGQMGSEFQEIFAMTPNWYETKEKIAAMSPEELDKWNLQERGIGYERVHPMYGAAMSGKQMEPLQEQMDYMYAGGGMVGIRKPNAIAPTGGPMSQGLRSLYINDKDY